MKKIKFYFFIILLGEIPVLLAYFYTKSLIEEQNKTIYELNTAEPTPNGLSLEEFIQTYPLFLFAIIFSIVCLLFFIIIFVILSKYRQTKIEAHLEKNNADNKARQDFLSRMSHEIRTPMNAIIGITDVIALNQNIPPEVSKDLEKLHSSAHYLLGLINNILDMSKLDQGKMQLTAEPFSITAMVNSLQNMLESEATRFNVTLMVHCEIEHDVILTDEIRMRQVLTNLISNAFKYTPQKGKVILTITEQGNTDTSATFFFKVQDTGIGIPPDAKNKIFEPFEQIVSDTSKSFGTGLGLPISQSIVRLMGGEIQLSSELSCGSTFSFELEIPLGKLKAAPKEENFESMVGKNILVVEDNEINAEIITAFLEMKGIIPQLTYNGKEGLEAFKSSPVGFYDVILMDIQMPGMDGITATKEIRRLNKEDATTVPIVAMTANTFKEDIENAIRSGMNDFLPKPIDIHALYRILGKYI